MTISRDTLQQQAPRSDAFPWVEQDGHTNMLRSLERETVRRDTASILAAETRRVREAAPTADTGRGLGSAVRILFGDSNGAQSPEQTICIRSLASLESAVACPAIPLHPGWPGTTNARGETPTRPAGCPSAG